MAEYRSITELGNALRSKELTSRELTEHSLAEIARTNPQLNAFLTVTSDEAIERAALLDRELAQEIDRGPLHGIPIAHKDIIPTKGVRTTAGSKILAHHIAEDDAEVVTVLDSAGAVMVGKTNLHEICYGITSNNPHFGAVHNPWDLAKIPGGSSGGSAAAVAAGIVAMATGTDTGGSIRIPAAFCGIVGLKPTFERVSRRGVMPLGLTLDCVGPLARTVRDAAVAFYAMIGSLAPGWVTGRAAGPVLKNLRVGIPRNFFLDRLDPEVRLAFRSAVQTVGALGAAMKEVTVPDCDAINQIGRLLVMAEAAQVWKAHLHRRGDFGSDVYAGLEAGFKVTEKEYAQAQRGRKELTAEFARIWHEVDLLLTPTTPTAAPAIGQTTLAIPGVSGELIEEETRVATTGLVRPFNVTGFPALSMPCGLSSARLPIGLQVVAAPGQDDVLLESAAALQEAAGWQWRPGV